MEHRKKTIFLVDDGITNLTVGKKVLIDEYTVVTLNSGARLLAMLEKMKPDLILLDINMPEMDGYEVIKQLKSESSAFSEIPVIFLTALQDEEQEILGLSLGAIDFITKPFSAPLLLKRLEMHLLVESQKRQLKDFNENLMQMVEERTRSIVELKNVLLTTIAELVESRDDITGGHIERTRSYIKLFMEGMKKKGIYKDELEKFYEEWDGSGYPRGLSGTEIPILGRIMAIVDVYDALVESRPYKNILSHEKAVNIINDGKGTHFDPVLVDLFNEMSDDFNNIREEF